MNKLKGLSLFKKSLLLLAVVALLICGYFLAVGTADSVAKTASLTGGLVEDLRLMRWGVIGLIILMWNKAVVVLASYRELSDERVAYAKSLRWRVAVYFVIFELVIIEGLPSKILGL